MNVSFYCKHCGKYRRRGNHSECKRILQEQCAKDAENKIVNLRPQRVNAVPPAQQRRYTAGDFEFLAGLDAPCIPDES